MCILLPQVFFNLQDLQLQQLQRKMSRLDGERTDDEKVALNARIKVSFSYGQLTIKQPLGAQLDLLGCPIVQELEEEWVRQQGDESMLSGQLKRLQDDLRRVNTTLEQGQKEKASLDEKIGQWNLVHSN